MTIEVELGIKLRHAEIAWLREKLQSFPNTGPELRFVKFRELGRAPY